MKKIVGIIWEVADNTGYKFSIRRVRPGLSLDWFHLYRRDADARARFFFFVSEKCNGRLSTINRHEIDILDIDILLNFFYY